MARTLPDTSCMVAALCAWHEHHERAVREIEERLSAGDTLVVAAPALVETYAVLTRLPPPYRLSAANSWASLDANFLANSVETVALAAEAYSGLLRRSAERGIAGGRVYDAVISACALAVRVDIILTFNASHFAAVVGRGIPVVVPT